MTNKITFASLSNSISLEIKMTNILSFYENIATSIAYEMDSHYFEIISIRNETDVEQDVTCTSRNRVVNIASFTKPLHRSNDIVSFLIEREQLQSINFTANN